MSTNDMTQLQAWFKTSYADRVTDLTPENVYYAKMIPDLPSAQQPGGTYTHPVTLTSEQGITKASASAGAFALNSPIAMSTQNATINGSQFLLRSGLDYETIYRSRNDKNAFIRATKGVVKNMLKSAWFYQEADIMWGQQGIATVSSISTNTITITTAEFAAGLWLGSENRKLRIESSAGVLRGTCAVSSYDIAARTVTVDSAPAGVSSTDVIFFEADGAAGANCMQGIYKILSPASASFMGINDSTYNLWAPLSAYGAGSAPLTGTKLLNCIAGQVNKGLGDEIRDIDVCVNPLTFQNIGNDLNAIREIDSSYKTTEMSNGAEAIVFHCQAGKVSLFAHNMMKEGYAFVHPKASKFFSKVGCQSTPTFALPGMSKSNETEYIRPMENNAGCESRLYWNSSVFSEMRAQGRIISGIVNATV